MKHLSYSKCSIVLCALLFFTFGNAYATGEVLPGSGTAYHFIDDGALGNINSISWQGRGATQSGGYYDLNNSTSTATETGGNQDNFAYLNSNPSQNPPNMVAGQWYLVFNIKLKTGKTATNAYVYPAPDGWPSQPGNNTGKLLSLNGKGLNTTTDTWVVFPLTAASANWFRTAFIDPDDALLIKDFYICLSAPTSTQPPVAITAGTKTCNSIVLNWATYTGATNYNIYQCDAAGGNQTLLQSNVTGTTYTVADLSGGTNYNFIVKANGVAAIYATDMKILATSTSAMASTPTIAVGAPDFTSASLSFTLATGAQSHTLFRGTSPTNITTAVAGWNGTSLTYKDTGLAQGTTYYYKLVANFAGGCKAQAITTAQTIEPFGTATGATCGSACNILVGYVNFAYAGSGTTPARWNLNDVTKYGAVGAANQNFGEAVGGIAANGDIAGNIGIPYTATGDLAADRYAIVSNPSTINSARLPNETKSNGGYFVLRSDKNPAFIYRIKGLSPYNTTIANEKKYCIRVKMRLLGNTDNAPNCNQKGNNVNVDIQDLDGSWRQLDNGRHKVTNATCTDNQSSTDWNGNNQQRNGLIRPGSYAVFEGTVTIGEENGFQIRIKPSSGDNYTMIESIEVFGCLPKVLDVLNPNGNIIAANQTNFNLCEGETLFLRATSGFAPAGSGLTWKKGSTTLPSTSNIIQITVPAEGVSETYRVTGEWGYKDVTVTGTFCCTASDAMTVFEEHFPLYTPTANCNGATISPLNPANGSTTYNYTSNDGDNCQLIEDEYAIVTHSHWSYWGGRTQVNEHSNLANSGAMFINAGADVNKYFYTLNLTGLCNSTRYELSAWYVSVATAGAEDPSNINFEIFNSANMSTPIAQGETQNFGGRSNDEYNNSYVWRKYSIQFQTPAAAAAQYTLRLRNKNGGASGNDLLIDDIVVTKCNSRLNTIDMSTRQSSQTVCTDEPVKLEISAPFSIKNRVANGADVWVQWLYSANPNGPWIKLTPQAILNDTIHQLTAANMPAVGNTRYFVAKLSGVKSQAETISPLLDPTDCGNDAISEVFSLERRTNLNISITPATTPFNVCEGSSQILQGATTETGATWGWKRGLTIADPFITNGGEASNQNDDKAYSIASMATADEGTYYFVVEKGLCIANRSVELNMTPGATPGTVTGGKAVCSGTNSTLLTLSGHSGTIARWQYSTNGGTIWNNIAHTAATYTAANLTQETMYRAVVSSVGCGETPSAAATITINTLPTPTAGSNSPVCVGAAINLTSTAATSYAWTGPGGYTASTQNPSRIGATTAMGGTYTVEVTDANGCKGTATTDVTIRPAFNAGAIATTGETICPNGTPTEIGNTIAASGGDGTITYSWYKDGVLISGATGATYTPPATDAATSGTYVYTRRAKDNMCQTTPQNSTGSWSLIVRPATVGGTLSPATETACVGTTVNFSLSGHTGTIVQSEQSYDNGATWANIVLGTLSQTTITSTASGKLLTRFLVQNGAGCPTAYSSTSTITINALSVGGTVGNASICSGGTANLSLTGQTGNVVKWQSSTDNATWTTDISNTTTSLTTEVLTSTTYYRAVVQNGVCPEVNSAAGTVTVSSQPTASISYDASPYCKTLTSATVSLSGSGGTFSKKTGTGTLTFVNTTTGEINPSASTAGDYTVTYSIPAVGACSSFSVDANITIASLPTFAAAPQVCPGKTVNVSGTNNGTIWTSRNTGIATVNNAGVVSGVAAGTVCIINENTNGCVDSVQVTVNALPTFAATPSACAGKTVDVKGANNGAIWTSRNPAVATVNNTGIVTGVSAGTVYILNTNTNGCVDSVQVTINALPTFAATPSACVGKTVDVKKADNGTIWTSRNTGIATVAGGVVTGVSAGTVYIINTNANGCADSVQVTINALPTFAATPSVCINGTVNVSGTNNGTIWTSRNTGIATVAGGAVSGVSAGTVYIINENANGCVDSVEVEILALPTATLPPLDAFCEGGGIEPSKIIAGNTISWYSDAAGTAVIAVPTIATLPAGDTTFYYTVEDNTTHCVGAVQTYSITVDSIPV
ncbi:MAG: hypothetical protein LBN27_00050, partial [Prevotellaceae bacterium]|nr:hypothetical protein [Prevotellaceae bacterium]